LTPGQPEDIVITNQHVDGVTVLPDSVVIQGNVVATPSSPTSVAAAATFPSTLRRTPWTLAKRPTNVDSRTRSKHLVICTRQSPEARRESLDSRLCWEVGGGNPKPS